MYTGLLEVSKTKTHTSIENWTKDINTKFTEKEILMGPKHVKGCSISYKIKECELNPH